MRRPIGFISYTERVLFVVDRHDQWVSQADVIRHTKMAPARAIAALRILTQTGELEWSKLFRGRGQGSGRPQFIYRRIDPSRWSPKA